MHFLKLVFAAASLLLVSVVFAQETNNTKITPGSYQIRNKEYGDLLRPENANGAVGTRIVLYPAQPWKCMTWRIRPAGQSTFELQNHFTSKTFATEPAPGKSDEPVAQVIFAKTPGENPSWDLSKLPDGTYKISDSKTGKVLTAVKEDGGLKVVVRAWHDKNDQKWELLPIDPKQLTM